MGVTPVIARSRVKVMGKHRPQVSAQPGDRAAELGSDRAPVGSISCQSYERLMAGETVSWAQIVREHPMLGQVTVAELVNAGVVQVVPDYDPGTSEVDFRLRKRDSAEVGLALDRPARQQWGLIVAPGERTSFTGGPARTGRPELKVLRRA